VAFGLLAQRPISFLSRNRLPVNQKPERGSFKYYLFFRSKSSASIVAGMVFVIADDNKFCTSVFLKFLFRAVRSVVPLHVHVCAGLVLPYPLPLIRSGFVILFLIYSAEAFALLSDNAWLYSTDALQSA